jgi:hypothetical protein
MQGSQQGVAEVQSLPLRILLVEAKLSFIGHPGPSIDPIMLQSMGNRMNKWFGWSRHTFLLAKQ